MVVVVVEIPHYELRLANVEVLRPFLAHIPKTTIMIGLALK